MEQLAWNLNVFTDTNLLDDGFTTICRGSLEASTEAPLPKGLSASKNPFPEAAGHFLEADGQLPLQIVPHPPLQINRSLEFTNRVKNSKNIFYVEPHF